MSVSEVEQPPEALCDLAVSETHDPHVFTTIFRNLEADSVARIGPLATRLLIIPIRDGDGEITGGLWGYTAFEWLHVQLLFVPAPLRNRGLGATLVAAAEQEARRRGCRGVHVDSFDFQAGGFYRKLGFTLFGLLPDFPPGHNRQYWCKRLDAVSAAPESPTAVADRARPAARCRMHCGTA